MKKIFKSTIEKYKSKKLMLNKLYKTDLKNFITNKYQQINYKIKNFRSIINNENFTYMNPKKLIRNLQDSLDQYTQSDKNEVILRPASYWASSITWTLLGGTFFGIFWLSIAKTEEIVVSTGKLEPIGKVSLVQMPLQGITKEILVEEGELVEKGQSLILLDTEITMANRKSIEERLKINNQILIKLEDLLKEGAISQFQYLQQKIKIEEIKSNLVENNVTLKYQKIIAPHKGLVFDLQPNSPGFVARTTDPVMKIVPLNNLQASIEIDSTKIGFVNVGKKVDISIDSYPASDFGVIKGTVKSIASDALPPNPSLNKGYRYPASIYIENQYLTLKDGKKLKLQPGMSLTANIKLRKVSYLQLLLQVFQNKSDSLRAI
tara:strand:- start:7077 stop:8207 length:1131 start_codon:yes stop_codon:yes gene_type:complete